MKIVKFIKYDISEGIFRYWKRYLLVILIVAIACVTFNREVENYLAVYDGGWSPLEYGINEFWGKYPFVYNSGNDDAFTLPFEWVMIYLTLAFCIGSYISDDMHGFGIQMMIKSRQRYRWWSSKCFWSICVNGIYFGLLWLVNCAFSWILKGNIFFEKNEMLLGINYGEKLAWTSIGDLIVMTLVMPCLVGVVQSLFQMLGTICLGSIPTIALISGILVISSYYSNRFLWHGYAMVSRYYDDQSYLNYVALDYHFGIPYCVITLVLIMVIGYFVIQKKNIVEK